jgi:hypothetical protein
MLIINKLILSVPIILNHLVKHLSGKETSTNITTSKLKLQSRNKMYYFNQNLNYKTPAIYLFILKI